MRRKSRSRKSGQNNNLKKMAILFMKKAFLSIFIILIITAVFRVVWLHISRLPYFEISDVVVPAPIQSRVDIRSLVVGENIFDVDLKKLSWQIKPKFPEIKKLVIRRCFPDKLIVETEKRISVAQIKFAVNRTGGAYGYFAIDNGGGISSPFTGSPQKDLPIISGLNGELKKTKLGMKYESKRLDATLSLLQQLSSSNLADKKISEINVSDYKNISFFLEDRTEVKISGTDFRGKIALLSRLLSELESAEKKPKYIDLRFKDPVIGWK